MSDFREIQRQFAAHIRDPDNHPPPEDVEPRRMALYRRLFHNNVQGFLDNAFPVLRSLYTAERWQALARQFFAVHASTSPYFVEIPGEFVTWLAEEYEPREDDPPFLHALAHYEYMEVVLRTSTEQIPETGVNPEGDLLNEVPVVSPLVYLVPYHWPVHRISPEHQPAEPLSQPVWLIIHRNRADQVRFMELNAATAGLLQMMREHPARTGQQHLEALATQLGHADPQAVVHHGTEMLETFRERDIIAGTRPSGPRP